LRSGAEVGKGLLDPFDMVDGEVHTPRTAALAVILLHRHTDGQIVDDRYRLKGAPRVSIHKMNDGVYKIRWREGGRNRSLSVHGPHELAKKVLRKKLSARDENRHLDVKKEINFRMSTLIERYWDQHAKKKKSQDREKSILEGIRGELGSLFVREVDGTAIDRWYQSLTVDKGLSQGTAVRPFNVMHHMMAKASTIWSKETGLDRNPADEVEVKRPDDERERYLSAQEIGNLKMTLDEKMYRKVGRGINKRFSVCD
jgi:hypothetical protein